MYIEISFTRGIPVCVAAALPGVFLAKNHREVTAQIPIQDAKVKDAPVAERMCRLSLPTAKHKSGLHVNMM